ncbi:hypothetical protein AB1Y32_16065, partial [Escherichia coli]
RILYTNTSRGLGEEYKRQPYITERAVFTLKEDGLQLYEIAPGVELHTDIPDKMDCTPVISPELKLMDERLFIDAAMGFVLPEAAH